jgi:hypothetical protein
MAEKPATAAIRKAQRNIVKSWILKFTLAGISSVSGQPIVLDTMMIGQVVNSH